MKKTKSILGTKKLELEQAKAELGRLALDMRGRNRGVFLCQLIFALWLAAAKIEYSASQRQQLRASGEKHQKPSPIATMLKALARANPTLAKRRALDGWVEALLAVLVASNVISPRIGGANSRLQQLRQLRQVTRKHLRKIVKDYGSMSELRADLFPNAAPKPVEITEDPITAEAQPKEKMNTLKATLDYLDASPNLSVDEIQTLGAIYNLATPILERVHPYLRTRKPGTIAESTPLFPEEFWRPMTANGSR